MPEMDKRRRTDDVGEQRAELVPVGTGQIAGDEQTDSGGQLGYFSNEPAAVQGLMRARIGQGEHILDAWLSALRELGKRGCAAATDLCSQKFNSTRDPEEEPPASGE